MANLICARCNQPVNDENMVECPFCWEIYHKECWEDTENCLTCKKYNPIYEMAQAQKEYEEKEQNEKIANEENVIEDKPEQVNMPEAPTSSVASSVLFASIVLLASGVLGGIALAVYMYLTGKLIVGVIGGVALAGVGFALSLVVKGVAEMVNNSQKNVHYISKLVRMVEDEE